MGKKIYVEGNILVKTRYFKANECGTLYLTPPEGTEIWKPNYIDKNGIEFFIIDDKNPQSMFYEYYAKGEFATYDNWVSYLFQSIDEVRDNYNQQIQEIKNLIKADNIHKEHNPALYKLYYVKIGTSLDAFICDTVLTIITSDESLFESFSTSCCCNIKPERIIKLKHKGAGFFEQEVIYKVLRKSYLNVKAIKDFFNEFYNSNIEFDSDQLNEYFVKRHLLVHRNGRDKNDDYIMVNVSTLNSFIKDADALVDEICNKVRNIASV